MGKNSLSYNKLISSNQHHKYGNGNGNYDKFDSRSSNSRSPEDRCNSNGRFRSPTRLYSKNEEDQLSQSLQHYYGKDLVTLLENSFNGKTYYLDVGSARLPSPNKLFIEEKWTNDRLSELQIIKRDLNSVKSKLDQYDLSSWHRHTRSMNPTDKVMKHLRNDVKVEFLTQAWCKFYELVNKYELIPFSATFDRTLFSFHLCEAPGAFVASLNHYIKLNHPNMKWYWRANSLNPYYEGNNLSEMINDDRFMLQTIDNWDFGPDMTGDVTHPDYPSYLRRCCGEDLPHLITADGSFDCQDKPDEQESSVSWLHLKETLNALNILRKDGNFVIKMFTFFECDTLCLLTLLAAAFQKIAVEKPATSKEGNSEVYVVCQKYRGRDAIAPYLDQLLQTDLETYQKYSMFPFDTCNELFYREIIECANHFATLQMNVIERNIRVYEINPDHPNLRKHSNFLQDKFVQHYIKTYKLRPIKMEDNIVKLVKREFVQIERKPPQVIESKYRKQGSHAERVQRAALEADDLLKKIAEELNDDHCRNLPTQLSLSRDRGSEIPVSAFEINFGKPIEVVRSSQFCHGRFMRIRNEMINMYGIRKFNIAATEMPSDCRNNCVYGDFSLKHMQFSCDQVQRESFYLIYVKLHRLGDGDNLKLTSFPLLTQFNINVLCVLRQIFEKVIFNAPNELMFIGLDIDKWDLWRVKLDKITRVYSPYQSVISFLPISYITGSDNAFYKWLVEVNNIRLYHEINRVIQLRPRT